MKDSVRSWHLNCDYLNYDWVSLGERMVFWSQFRDLFVVLAGIIFCSLQIYPQDKKRKEVMLLEKCLTLFTFCGQPCLGGDSKTLMFVNVSPDPLSVGESICSLRFAARVNSCEIGVARRQTSTRPLDSRLSCG